jgi:putative addiction module component (TIGR02574 family)
MELTSSKLVKAAFANQTEAMSIPEETHETPSVVDQNWKKEIDRRIQEMETGQVRGVPLEESLTRARKIAGL